MANAPAKNDESLRPRWTEWLIVLALGFGLTWVFFAPLWTGGGLIGGDLYTYFMPQKQFYAERLADGEFPLWHNRSGYGYPLVAESQTGAFYPPHLLLYSTFDVTTAYNLNQLIHYVLTFLLVWLYAREVGVKALAAYPRKSIKRNEGQRDLPVHFADVTFVPGHHVYADPDGVIVSEKALL